MFNTTDINQLDLQNEDTKLECPFGYEIGMAGDFDGCYYCEFFEECEKLG